MASNGLGDIFALAVVAVVLVLFHDDGIRTSVREGNTEQSSETTSSTSTTTSTTSTTTTTTTQATPTEPSATQRSRGSGRTGREMDFSVTPNPFGPLITTTNVRELGTFTTEKLRELNYHEDAVYGQALCDSLQGLNRIKYINGSDRIYIYSRRNNVIKVNSTCVWLDSYGLWRDDYLDHPNINTTFVVDVAGGSWLGASASDLCVYVRNKFILYDGRRITLKGDNFYGEDGQILRNFKVSDRDARSFYRMLRAHGLHKRDLSGFNLYHDMEGYHEKCLATEQSVIGYINNYTVIQHGNDSVMVNGTCYVKVSPQDEPDTRFDTLYTSGTDNYQRIIEFFGAMKVCYPDPRYPFVICEEGEAAAAACVVTGGRSYYVAGDTIANNTHSYSGKTFCKMYPKFVKCLPNYKKYVQQAAEDCK